MKKLVPVAWSGRLKEEANQSFGREFNEHRELTVVEDGPVCLWAGDAFLEEWEWPEEGAVASGPHSFHLGGPRFHPNRKEKGAKEAFLSF